MWKVNQNIRFRPVTDFLYDFFLLEGIVILESRRSDRDGRHFAVCARVRATATNFSSYRVLIIPMSTVQAQSFDAHHVEWFIDVEHVTSRIVQGLTLYVQSRTGHEQPIASGLSVRQKLLKVHHCFSWTGRGGTRMKTPHNIGSLYVPRR